MAEFDFTVLESELAGSDLETARHYAAELGKVGRILAAIAAESGGSVTVDMNAVLALGPVTLKYDLDEDGNVLTVHLIEA